MRTFAKNTQHLCAPALLFTLLLAASAPAGPPVPLESAYWRFEEGPASSQVPANADVVLDSINDNHMRGFENATVDATPTYVTTVPPTPLRSGLPNNLALDFVRNPTGGGDDLFSLNQAINNGIIAPGGGFTVEAAFRSNNPALFAGIVSREGQPGGGRPVQTFVLKTRADNSLLSVEQWDANANLVQVSSLEPMVAGQWYYAAVVNDGSTLSLYLDSNDGAGYQLQGSVAVQGALYQAVPTNPSWDNNWTIGRGEFGGHPADWFDGIIDEVRLTNAPLSASQFLFAPAVEPVAGDYNEDGKVDAADYVVWRKTLINGQQGYSTWRTNFGRTASAAASSAVAAAVPEPATVLLGVLAACALAIVHRRPRLLPAPAVLPRRTEIMKMSRGAPRIAYSLFASGVVMSSVAMADVPSNPLESAYWRFEDGPSFTAVDHLAADPVKDSINQNHMDAFDANTAPGYTTSVPPTPLQSGLQNTLALDFIPHAGGGDDLITQFNTGDAGKGAAKNINNGFIAPGGGFTLEAAFNTNNPNRWAAIVGKEGRPGGTNQPVQTLVLKTRASNDPLNSHLFFEQWDGSGALVGVNSLAPLVAGQWYYAAIVNNGTTLSMYLDSNNGQGYQLQESIPVNGALFQGVPANPLWDAVWTIGRGQFGGNPADWFDGLIDEVRLSNTALAPSQFLFAPAGGGVVVPEPGALALLMMGVAALGMCRRRRIQPHG